MAIRLEDLLPLVADLQADQSADWRLDALAARTGLSPTHLQRVFTRMIGESPRRIATRIALDRAAADLVTTGEPILEIALASGYDTHEGFSRAFRRQFDRSPAGYRARGLEPAAGTRPGAREVHRSLVHHTTPCINLFGVPLEQAPTRSSPMAYTIEEKTLPEQPFLFMTRRVPRSGIAAALGEMLGGVFGYAMKSGAALASPPLCRYRDMNAGGMTLEAGVAVAAPVAGAGDVLAGTLPAGAVASTVHAGPYDRLPEAYAAVEKWIAEKGLKPAGAPWEVYLTDPTEVPDPAQWRTEVNWPVSA